MQLILKEVMLRVEISIGGFVLIILESLSIGTKLSSSHVLAHKVSHYSSYIRAMNWVYVWLFFKVYQASHVFNYIVLRAMLMSEGQSQVSHLAKLWTRDLYVSGPGFSGSALSIMAFINSHSPWSMKHTSMSNVSKSSYMWKLQNSEKNVLPVTSN